METLLKLMTEYYNAGNEERGKNPVLNVEDVGMAKWSISKALAKNASATEALNAAIAADPVLYKAARDYLDSWWEYCGDGGLGIPRKPSEVTRANPAIRAYRPALRYLAVIAMY